MIPDSAAANIAISKHERDALIRRAYEGEIIGCVMYRDMIAREIPGAHGALRLLYELERVTAKALEPVAASYNVSVDRDAATAEGLKLASDFARQSWNSMWENIVELADDYLRDFYRLMSALDGGEYSSVGRQVVEYEER